MLFFVVKPHEVKLLEWVCFLQSQSLKKLEPITQEWEWAWWILIGEKDQRELMSVPMFHFHSGKIPILGHQAGVKGMSVIVKFFESCTAIRQWGQKNHLKTICRCTFLYVKTIYSPSGQEEGTVKWLFQSLTIFNLSSLGLSLSFLNTHPTLHLTNSRVEKLSQANVCNTKI